MVFRSLKNKILFSNFFFEMNFLFIFLFIIDLNLACLPSKSLIYSELKEEVFNTRNNCGPAIESYNYGSSLNKRIVNGNESNPEFFPWVVIITQNFIKKCSGSLISFEHVITAAHCIQGSLRDTHVLIGLTDFKNPFNPDNIFSVTKVTIHPEYSGNKNDVVILKLSRKVDLFPICMPISSNYKVILGKKVVVAGW